MLNLSNVFYESYIDCEKVHCAYLSMLQYSFVHWLLQDFTKTLRYREWSIISKVFLVIFLKYWSDESYFKLLWYHATLKGFVEYVS